MSGVLRPLLLTLAKEGWFIPVWSDKIGNEWRRNAARVWDVAPTVLDDAWQAMEAAHPEANLSKQPIPQPDEAEPVLTHSDPKDWHVILTAWQARMTHDHTNIVTWNLKDFRRSELRFLGLNVMDPDRLLTDWYKTHRATFEAHLQSTVQTLIDEGRRRPDPLPELLIRERLFRLRKQLITASN